MSATRFALFPWFEENGRDHIHPDDLERLRRLAPYGKVFRVSDGSSGYAVLSYGEQDFRVKPALLSEVPPPTFIPGDQVVVRDNPLRAIVADVLWHHQLKRPFYHLRIGTKTANRRYWDDDVTAAVP